jgi:hypothetical protein
MWRLAAVGMTVIAVGLFGGCQKKEERSLVERLYEHRLKRCETLVEDKTECDPPPGATYRDGANHLHRVMVRKITEILPERAQCTMHGYQFLICEETEKQEEGETGKAKQTMYRLGDAKDGSDSRVMYVWSDEW